MSRAGGTYINDGKKTRLVDRTTDHPDGNRPRDANGNPLGGVPPKRKPALKSVPTDKKE